MKKITNLLTKSKKALLALLITANLAAFATGSANLDFASESALLATPSAIQESVPTVDAPKEAYAIPQELNSKKLKESFYIEKKEAAKINKDTTGEFVSDEIIVDFIEGLSADEMENVLKNNNLKIARDKIDPNSKVVKVMDNLRDVRIELLKKNPNVKDARRNGIGKVNEIGNGGFSFGAPGLPASNEPNDPYYQFQWNLHKIKMKDAWNWTKGNSDTIVAVLDSGVNYNHNDLLAGRIIKGYDFVSGDSDPMDEYDHGTATTGLIAANTNNGLDLASVNWFTRVLAIRIVDGNGFTTADRMENGIRYAGDYNSVKILSISVREDPDPGITNAILEIIQTKTVIAASRYPVGYEQTPHCDVGFPASVSGVISVNGTDEFDNEVTGCGMGSTINDFVVSAPGMRITTLNQNGGYSQRNGSSFAAPQVSALAAMIWSCAPASYTDAQKNTYVKDSIRSGLDPTGVNNSYYKESLGRINARKALDHFCF